jgi:hypothetical protein
MSRGANPPEAASPEHHKRHAKQDLSERRPCSAEAAPTALIKSGAASRMVPIHPAPLELGLTERAAKLQKLGHTRLFPDLRPANNGGVLEWGHALARDWQKRKALVTKRTNVTAYSGRQEVERVLTEKVYQLFGNTL